MQCAVLLGSGTIDFSICLDNNVQDAGGGEDNLPCTSQVPFLPTEIPSNYLLILADLEPLSRHAFQGDLWSFLLFL